MKQKRLPKPRKYFAATRHGKASVTLFMDCSVHKDLKRLAIDLDYTLEGLMRQAIVGVLKQHGRPTEHLDRADRQAG